MALTKVSYSDNEKLELGIGNDLQIYFDGSNSYIKEPAAVAGQLIIDGWNGTDIRQGETGDLMGRFIGGGAVTLYWDGDPKLSTDSNGILIETGAYVMAGARINFKNSWNSNITSIRNQGANAANEGNMEFKTGADTLALTLDKDQNATFAGNITSSHETASTDSVEHLLTLAHTSSGTTTTGFGTGIRFQGERNQGALQTIGELNLEADVNSGTTISCAMVFKPGVAGVPTEALKLSSSLDATFAGKVRIGSASATGKLLGVNQSVSGDNIVNFTNGSDAGYGVYVSGGTNANYALKVANHAGTEAFKVLGNGTTTIAGDVTINGGASTQLTLKGTEADLWLTSTGSGSDKIWRILGSTGGNTHKFRIYDNTNDRDAFTIANDGNATLSHNAIFNAGYGCHFGAATGSGSTSTVLDDYEEGNHNPTDESGQSLSFTNNNTGIYTKIGAFIHFSFDITYPTTTNGDDAKITAPFMASSNNHGGGVVGFTSLDKTVLLHINTGGVFLRDEGGSNLTNAQCSGKRFIGQLMFRAA